MSIPEVSNCYGQIWSADLGAVCEAALGRGPWTVTRCDRSGYDGHWRLHIDAEDILELASDGPLNDGSYLFNGGVDTGANGRLMLAELSARLSAVGVPHRLELYGADACRAPVVRRSYLWPELRDRPEAPLWEG